MKYITLIGATFAGLMIEKASQYAYRRGWSWPTVWLFRIVIIGLGCLLVAGKIHGQTASLTVTWTAPGDPKPNGTLSRCAAYQVRLDTLPIDSTNCTTAKLFTPVPIPKPPNQPETLTFFGLLSEHWYYVNIRSVDSVGNWSMCSNFIGKSTPDTRPPTRIIDALFR